MITYKNNNYLMHHGVKGMKWGVRRYRNKDGTLTNLGKLRYSKPVDANNMDRKKFIKILNTGRDFVLKKSQQMYRTTSSAHEQTVGKKYVSVRASDIGIYNQFVQGNSPPGSDIYDITYSAKNNMAIAGTRTQAKLLQKIYGKNFRTDEKFKERVNKGWIDLNVMNKSISDMTDRELHSYLYYNPFGHNRDILNAPISNKETKRYIDELSKKGYDAAVDMLDLAIGYSDGPIVVLKSENNLETKSYKKAY